MIKGLHEAAGRAIQDAWQHKDLELLGNSLGDTVSFYENVFEPPLTDKQSIIHQWKTDLAQQNNISAQITLLDWVENRGYHHCVASWKNLDGTISEIDAVYIIKLDAVGKISSFKPWYTSKV